MVPTLHTNLVHTSIHAASSALLQRLAIELSRGQRHVSQSSVTSPTRANNSKQQATQPPPKQAEAEAEHVTASASSAPTSATAQHETVRDVVTSAAEVENDAAPIPESGALDVTTLYVSGGNDDSDVDTIDV